MEPMKEVTVSDIMQIQSISPGFRFCPTDVELVSHYLRRKNQGLDLSPHVLADVEITKCEPWDLPGQSILKSDHEWFFFVPTDRRYPKGAQAKRATNIGFWKATGKEREIRSRKNVIGTKRTLVFHIGRAPKGQRTNWIMTEYCLKENKDHYNKKSYVLCRVRKKQDSGNNSDSDDNLYPGEADKASSSKVHSDGHVEDISGVKDGESFEDMQEADEGSDIFKEDGDLKVLKQDDESPKKLFQEDDDLLVLKRDDESPKKLFKEDLVDGFKEDDCFSEILKDDIVELDDNPFYRPIMSKTIQPVHSFKLVDGLLYEGTMCRTAEAVLPFTPRTRPVRSFMQNRDKLQGDADCNIQGTANRRIRLEKSKRSRQLHTKRSSGDSNIVERWLKRVIWIPLLCIVCVVMVVLLLLFAFVF